MRRKQVLKPYKAALGQLMTTLRYMEGEHRVWLSPTNGSIECGNLFYKRSDKSRVGVGGLAGGIAHYLILVFNSVLIRLP
jgi:hypothetical protein